MTSRTWEYDGHDPADERLRSRCARRATGNRGVRLYVRRGRPEMTVPPSDRSPIATRPPGRAVRVRPGETRELPLPD
ncbi:hypothetical protein [Streptomyces sp. T028]|uniref:hypothetical protein n=1 Tax=Streptomyces sp. T028 TaxID=3394379 RepID=UPI003A89DB02